MLAPGGEAIDIPAALTGVALGGAAGGMLRHLVATGVERLCGAGFPWGTLAVNVSGCAAAGAMAAALLRRPELMAAHLWLAAGVGILGSYTTVSSFSLQTVQLALRSDWGRATANAAASMALCGLAAWAGFAAADRLLGGIAA
ncbi:MAG: fluoride efflux transporter FluC [Rubrimonas sp.]